MCMEDIRIGRKTNTIERLVPLTAGTDKQLVGPNDSRIALHVWIVTGNAVYLSTNAMTAQNQGLKLNISIRPFVETTLDTYGNLVMQPWHVLADVDALIAVFEVFLTDK